MSRFFDGDRVERTDEPDWGPGNILAVNADGEARVRFAGGFVVAWVKLSDLRHADTPTSDLEVTALQ